MWRSKITIAFSGPPPPAKPIEACQAEHPPEPQMSILLHILHLSWPYSPERIPGHPPPHPPCPRTACPPHQLSWPIVWILALRANWVGITAGIALDGTSEATTSLGIRVHVRFAAAYCRALPRYESLTHFAIDTQFKPYKCHICSKTFMRV